jgi:hypothetical protein
MKSSRELSRALFLLLSVRHLGLMMNFVHDLLFRLSSSDLSCVNSFVNLRFWLWRLDICHSAFLTSDLTFTSQFSKVATSALRSVNDLPTALLTH